MVSNVVVTLGENFEIMESVHLHRWRTFYIPYFPTIREHGVQRKRTARKSQLDEMAMEFEMEKWYLLSQNWATHCAGVLKTASPMHVWVRQTGWMKLSSVYWFFGCSYMQNPLNKFINGQKMERSLICMPFEPKISETRQNCHVISIHSSQNNHLEIKTTRISYDFFFYANVQYLYPLLPIYGVSSERKMKFVRLQFRNDCLEAEPSCKHSFVVIYQSVWFIWVVDTRQR